MRWFGRQHPYGRPQNGDVIIGPSLPATLSRPSMAKSGQSKLSVKSAVKEVLGGGGNDHDEWKFQNTFVRKRVIILHSKWLIRLFSIQDLGEAGRELVG